MRKKLTILFALLCASMMGWATIDWDAVDYLGSTEPSISGNTYKYALDSDDAEAGPNGIANIQPAAETGILGLYTHYGSLNVVSCSHNGKISGTQLWVYVDQLTEKDTKITVTLSDKSTRAFHLYNKNGGAVDPTPTPDPEPEPEPDPNSYTAGGHTIHLDASYVNDIYTLNITSTDNMEGLGGSFWYVNGASTDMRSNSGTNSYIVSGDKKTITCQVQSSSAPSIHTPLFVLMPGEINFGNVTLNWEDRTPITSEYCNYQGPETQQDGHYYAITWETDPSGNVVITIGNGTGAGECSFRNGGFEGGNNGLDNFVVSDDNFATTTPATDYFTVTRPQDGDLQYVMTKIADLPANAKIKHLSAGAIAWREAGTNRWCNPEFIYTYGGTCNQLDAPTNVAIDADNILTFDAVAGADSYMAYVSLGGVEKYSQAVAPGDELTFVPLVSGDYTIKVIASGAGKVDSDPSADVVWHLEAAPVVLGNSEYCEKNMSSGNTEAAFTWKTDATGNIVITISEVLNGSNDPAHFRANAFKDGIKVGASKESLSTYFNIPATIAGEDHSQQSLTYTLIDPANAPALGEKIYYHGVVEYRTSENKDAWPTLDFEWTYGTVCSGKSVSASVNNNTMGSAVAKVGEDEVTSVDEGTEVRFIATANPGYVFVNWTKGGVEVSTKATYVTTITETTNLVANFDYVRNTYCHSEVLTNNGKKLYLSVSKVADNTYKIRIDGSAEARINGRNNFNLVINNTNDYSNAVYDEVTKSGWKVSNEGNGYIENTFTANDYKALTFGSHYFAIGAQGGGEFILDNNFPAANTIAWNSTCSDTEAPVFNKAEAEVLNESSVRLKIQATDNWGGTITYNINYKPTGDNGTGIDVQATGASGEQITKDIEGLTTNKEYTFTITASDGVNVSAAQTCKATPAGDVNAPTNVTISAVALTNTIVRLTLSADDDYAGDITYNIAYDNAGIASTSAAQGTSTTLDITGLTADREYHFSVVATDAANNSSDAVNASAVRTFAANLALNRPCTAGHETGNAGEVKEKSNDGNKGSRWSSGGSAVHGDDISTSQDWWYVDLGAVYDIKNIRMFWEGARPSKYKFFTSNDAIAWTEVANLLVSPSYSANASAVMDYLNDINADAQGRYVKVWGYEDTNNNWAYGISFWELEVYGTPAVDGVAPVISSFEASGASTTSVLLKATADDNFKGDLTYTFYCNDAAQGEPVVKAAGEEATMTVNGLTMGINYNFKVNVSDGTNNTMSDVVVGTPINDNQAPNHVTVTSEATDYSITLTLSATDNLGGMIYYTVTCGETVKNAEALSGEQVNVLFDGLDYNTPYAFSVVAKDGSENAAEAVAHNKSTLPATYPTSYAPAPAFAEASVRPVFSSAYNKDCNFPEWGGSAMVRETYGAKKATFDKAYLGIDGFGTIKLDADDELYLSVWTNENIQFRVVPIIHNADNTANLPERGAFTQTLTGGQWNVVRFTMSDFVLNDADVVVEPNENYDRIYQIKIDRAANQTFWLDNIYFRRRGALNETDNAEFIAANNNEGQDITIPRTFPLTTEWYTLCLPFDLSDEQLTEAFGAGYTLATLANSVDHGSLISLNFNFIHSFEAGKAYLLRPGTAVTENPVFEGVVVKNVNPEDVAATSPLMNFQGTYNTILLNSENQRFVGPENYLYSPAEGGTNMKAFRCFFTIPQNSPLNGAPGRPARIVFGEQTATGMESVQGDDVQSAKVLMDGQLFIIREGRTYNAQGILVK